MLYICPRLQRVGMVLAVVLGAPFAAPGAVPDTQTLRGEVVDQSSAPIVGAVCTLWGRTIPEQGRPVTTGDRGGFEFTGLFPDTYRVTCAALGYEPVSKTDIQINPNEAAPSLQITLSRENVVRTKVEVTAEAPKATAQTTAPPATMTNQQMKALPLVTQKFK